MDKGVLLSWQLQDIRYLDIAELNEVQVKIVSCALVHSVGDEHFSADNLRHIRYLDIAELNEVEVKIVSCALVHSVGDGHFSADN